MKATAVASRVGSFIMESLLIASERTRELDWDAVTAVAMAYPDGAVAPRANWAEMGRSLEPDLSDIVAELGGFAPPPRPTSIVGLTRREWLATMVPTIKELMDPMTGLLARRQVSQAATAATVMELGTALGYVSRRVLGHYDWPLVGGRSNGAIYLIEENIETIAERLDANREELLVWLMAHELTHAAQFHSVDWLGPHLRRLVAAHLRSVEKILADRTVASLSFLPKMMNSPEMRSTRSLMAVLEGQADFVMIRVGRQLFSHSRKFSAFIERHQVEKPFVQRILDVVLGLEAKMEQYRSGRAFLERIYAEQGPRALKCLWASPEFLPSLEELAGPEAWLRRIG